MDDPLLVRVGDRLRHLEDEPDCLGRRDRPRALDPRIERLALDEAHDEVEEARLVARRGDAHDPLVPERGEELRLALEAHHLLARVLARGERQDLERVLRVPAADPEDGAHAAPAEDVDHLVAVDHRALLDRAGGHEASLAHPSRGSEGCNECVPLPEKRGRNHCTPLLEGGGRNDCTPLLDERQGERAPREEE